MTDKKEGVATDWVRPPKQDFKKAIQKERRQRNLTYIRKREIFAKKKQIDSRKVSVKTNLKNRRFKRKRIHEKVPLKKALLTKDFPTHSDRPEPLIAQKKISAKNSSSFISRKNKPPRLSHWIKNETQQKLKEESGYNETVVGELNHGMDHVRASKDGVKAVVHLTAQTAKTAGKAASTSYSLLKNRQRIMLRLQQRVRQVAQTVMKFLANPLLILKGISLGALALMIVGFLLVIVVSLTTSFSSATTKTDEWELTRTWNYLTDLDAKTTLEIQKGKKKLEINGAPSDRDKVQIRTNFNEVLAYLDAVYNDYELNGVLPATNQTTKEFLQNVHRRMIQKTSKKGKDQYKTRTMSELMPLNKDTKEQLDILKEAGQFVGLEELDSPLKNQNSLVVDQRYGYFILKKKKKFFNGLTFQSDAGVEVVAPLSGKMTTAGEVVTITDKSRKVVFSNLEITRRDRRFVNAGQVIGKTKKKEKVKLSYEKSGKSVNPAFYLPHISYGQSSAFGLSFKGSSFDEEQFRSIIRLKGNAFRNKADKIIKEAKKAGISPVIFAAIMAHESGWGTSQAIRQHNNPSGQMTGSSILHFDSLDKGIEATGRTLHNLIIERKLQTVERLGSVYCPLGAANDPKGLNKYWVPAIKGFMVDLGGQKNMSLLWSSASSKGGKALEAAYHLYKKGVHYTQDLNRRGHFPYHDCSSFVTWAMKQAGVGVSIGSTEYLYGLEGTILQPIYRKDIQAGDLFVWGAKGNSSGNFGHTGFFTDKGGKHILHATPATQGGFGQKGDVVETPFEGYFGDTRLAPVYFYRIIY